MKVKLTVGSLKGFSGLVVLPVSEASLKETGKKWGNGYFRAIDSKVRGSLSRMVKDTDFKGGHLATAFLPVPSSGCGVLLVGWGPSSGELNEASYQRQLSLRKLGNLIFDFSKKGSYSEVSVCGDELSLGGDGALIALIEGVILSSYSFSKYKSDKTTAKFKGIKELKIATGKALSEKDSKRAIIGAQATIYARDLVNTPARDCTPSYLVSEAKRIAKSRNLGVKVFSVSELRKLGADLMLSVFDSSNEEPFLTRLHYKPKGNAVKRVVLVGKGVTFDSGGLSIKTATGMMEMKDDMGGAAAVLATMDAIGQLKPNVEVIAFMPTTENMINPSSTRPGDVVKSLNGKTVEVLNTDAEGRLILGDTLVLAEKEKPDFIVDLATLTGAIAAATGPEYAGLFATEDTLAAELIAASAKASERLWRMPLAPEYRERIKSSIADIRNIGGPDAGCITAALFLKEFVGKTPWAHLDIAGTAFSDSERGYIKKGGTGFGVRTLLNWIEAMG